MSHKLFYLLSFSSHVNIQTTPNDEADVIFHLSMRADEGQMVRNSLDSEDGWGEEERSEEFPVTAGVPFKLSILAEENQFVVSINGQFFCDFAYRKPLTQGHFIEFLGIAESLKIDNPTY